jgi:hypothetical protein
MAFRSHKLDARLAELDSMLGTLRGAGTLAGAIDRWRTDAAALRFHLSEAGRTPLILAIIGGTGTGKSTLLNRLLDAKLSATSFKRTHTTGPLAVAKSADAIPNKWLGVEHAPLAIEALPARGEAGSLAVVAHAHPLTDHLTLVDTPDLDGDQPAHHAQADRAFRWAHAVLFLVTPEKYQMTELLPYYRLARRYAMPAVFVMNKCEEQAVAEDFAAQLAQRDWPDAGVFVIPRDDAGYEPPADANLTSLREELRSVSLPDEFSRTEGLSRRTSDLLDRFRDQVLAPLRQRRAEVDRIIATLRAMETPPAGVDVNPITQQLQRRLQQRSILYLMGPQRVLDRVRQVPAMLVRLPRTAWDWVIRGEMPGGVDPTAPSNGHNAPDFRVMLADQFTIVQSRIDDAMRSGSGSLNGDLSSIKLDPAQASAIADEEIADLRDWLERRWNAQPRDTLLLMKVLRHLPGGDRITKWTEAAPYLLAIIVATHHAMFGPVDLVILGGFGLFTWVSERLSNEVKSRTRQTNRKIADRFSRLAHEQIERACAWLDQQAPGEKALRRMEELADRVNEDVA